MEFKAEDFNVGDLVWAKMKGYPLWPGTIVEPSSDVKAPKQQKSHYILFFGSDNFAWITDENIKPHSESVLNSVNRKDNKKLQAAIAAFINFSANKIKEESCSPREENLFEQSLPMKVKDENEIEALPGMKVNDGIKTLTVQNTRQLRPRKVLPRRKCVEKRKCTSIVNVGNSGYKKKRNLESRAHTSASSFNNYESSSYVTDNYTPNIKMEHGSSSLETPVILHPVNHGLPSKKKIGFIGLGHIGKPLICNLLTAGHDVTLWNKSTTKTDVFKKGGVKIASSPEELIFLCDITFCSVSDPAASKEVVFGERGVLKGLEQAEKLGMRNKGYVEMTSIDPKTSQEIQAAIVIKQGTYLEAPICGTSKNAREGTLCILASGNKRLFDDCQSCFHAMATRSYFMSNDVGNGNKMSLVLSTLSGTVTAAMAEAVILTKRLNMDENFFLEVLKNGSLHSSSMVETVDIMLKKTFTNTVVTPLKHVQKDMHLSLLMANEFYQPMPVTTAANEIYKHARFLTYSECDVTSVYRAVQL